MTPLKWISAETNRGNYVTIDSQHRIYVSARACETVGVPGEGEFWLHIGYDAVNKRLVFAKPDIVRLTNVQAFRFDKRRYGSARAILRAIPEVTDANLPLHYRYAGREYGDYPDGAYAYQLADYEAPDDRGRSDK